MNDISPIIGNEDCDQNNDDLGIHSTDTEELTVDEILLRTGPFGRYQFLVLCLCMFFSIGFSFQTLITYYTADDSPWVCTNQNNSKFCSYGTFKEGSDFFTRRCKMNRDDWQYVYPKKYSVVTEYDLVCSREYLKALVTSCFFVGCCIGSLLAGPLGDYFGRKLMINICFLISFIASLAGYFVAAVWQYLALRVLIGLSFGQGAVCVYIYLSENNAPKTRNWVGNVYFAAYTISMLLVSLICYYVPFWRKSVIYTSSFPFVALILSLFLLKSPHWLVAKNRMDDAEQNLKKIAKINRKFVDFRIRKISKNIDSKKYSYIDLFNNCKVFKVITFQSYLWLVNGLVFYGIALESSNLGGNLYTNFILSSLADLPACLIALVLSMFVGRKKSVCTCLLLGGLFCGAIGLLSEKMVTLRVLLAIFCRMFLGASFDLQFLWTFEINPTVVRSQGMNVCQFFSRIGSIAAPFFSSVLQDEDPKLPFFIMGAISLLGAFITMFLPETSNKPTRENYKDFFESKTEEVLSPAINHVG